MQRASPMQGSRLSSQSSWSSWKRGGSGHVFETASDISETSYCSTEASRNGFNKSMSSSRRSLRVAAQEIAGSLMTCFIPVRRKGPKSAIPTEISFSSKSTSSSASKLRDRNTLDERNAKMGNFKFSIKEIYKATCNFSPANKIGQGHYGNIYKGRLPDGSFVAVKRAKKNMYEKIVSGEFENEIQTLSKVEHLNLVRFLGFLEEDDEQIIVVEYVGNGNLREHLDGVQGEGLEVAQRLEIAIDVAHAVAYLHTYTDHPIIHRDIKATNILITEKLRAKVADFGFARLASDDPEVTHVSTQIKGTAGYLDPEYLKTYQLTDKSDVYSFGALLVELVTGRRPIEPNRRHERMTLRWAQKKYEDGDVVIAMDPRLRRSPASILAAEKMLGLARQCLSMSRHSRPSMTECVKVLWEIRRDCQKIESCTSRSTNTDGGKMMEGASSSSSRRQSSEFPPLGARTPEAQWRSPTPSPLASRQKEKFVGKR